LVGNPTFANNFLSIGLKGEFYNWNNRQPPRFFPSEMPNYVNDKVKNIFNQKRC
jgi:hypothetical protein